MKKLSLLLLSFILILWLAACGQEEQTSGSNDEKESGNEVLEVFTSLYPLEYFASEIGGEYVKVTSILPQGADPHNFEPTSKLMVEIAEGDLFIYNGANMETYASAIEDAVKDEDVKIVEAAEGISLVDHIHDHTEGTVETEQEHSEEEAPATEDEHSHEVTAGDEEADHNHGDVDPHVWLDPTMAIGLAENIKDALIEANPDQADIFEENFHSLEERLVALDDEFHETIEQAANNEILVTHAAYGYWEQSYGIEQIAITGISPSDEPSQKEIEMIIEHVGTSGIQYLLFEQNVEPKVAQVIQDEADVESLELHNLSILTEKDIDNGETYFTLMERNLEVLEKALEY
ncbi:zinc transport system substrate-binding protein [Gracilibacillus ureilyticus]|uniref:Zinc transport system substrate-binding protein n=1 Tax=Gracilibacillus ureilyticus TaxID=531814 RepID=A0A1H9P7K2_9BACI|nr:zinc ABC transporter substrate-binding protein [Gracilibacillus ureilyticus]SER43769.1 zinc transport system substrate-binding protein [Gracilibacillus ureilyticus]